jgi:hypothetical protein
MNEVALGQVLVRILPFFPANKIPPMRHSHSSTITTATDLFHKHFFLSVLLSTHGKMGEISSIYTFIHVTCLLFLPDFNSN